jgi:hypothetical protein
MQKLPESTTDHLGRTDKDFAIEFGEYLAKAAEHFQDVMQAERAGDYDQDAVGDAWRALDSAIYEFRKRATKA